MNGDALSKPEHAGSGALPGPDWLDKWDTDKLMELLKAQSLAKIERGEARVRAQKLDPRRDVPEKNAWGRPCPPKVERTKIKKWWKQMADKVLPPLPQGEWEVLEALATGRAKSDVSRRRPMAKSMSREEPVVDKSWEMERYLLEPTRLVDRKSSRKQVLRTGIPQQNDEFDHAAGPIPSRTLPARTMRRIYLRTWQESPLMAPRPGVPGKWDVRYGCLQENHEPVGAQTTIFEGVNAKGVPSSLRASA
jgi:hypothetical protein